MSDVSKGWIWNMKRQTQDTVILLGLVTREEMASMVSLLGSSQAVLEGSIQLSGSRSLSVASNNRVNVARPGFGVRAQQVSFENETRRCVVLGLVVVGLGVGSFAKDGLAAATSIKVGPPPPTSGGLPGTENSDEARDLDIQLKKHFYMQPLPPTEVAARAKEFSQGYFKCEMAHQQEGMSICSK